MGYTGAMGTMIIDEMAGMAERSEERFTSVRTDLGVVEAEMVRARNWSRTTQDHVEGLDRHVRMLIASRMVMGNTIDQLRADMDGLLMLNHRMSQIILQMRAARDHGPGNPIVVDDDVLSENETVAETPEIPEGALLVPIESEEEESSDDEEEIWEISREEFEEEVDNVVDTRGESPEL